MLKVFISAALLSVSIAGAQQINLATQVKGHAAPANGGTGMDTSNSNGCAKVTNGVWSFSMANCGGGGSGGSGTPFHVVSYNSAGAQAQTNFITDATGNTLTVPGSITSGGVTNTVQINSSIVNVALCTLGSGQACNADSAALSASNPPAGASAGAGYAATYNEDESILNTTGPGRYQGDVDGSIVWHQRQFLFNANSRATNQQLFGVMHGNTIGDKFMLSFYMFSKGGCIAPGDECAKTMGLYNREDGPAYQGTITATTGVGDTAPALSVSNQGTDSAFLDGGDILILNRPLLSSSITGARTAFQSTSLSLLPTTSAVPLTTALATSSSDILVNQQLANQYTTVTFTANLLPIGGATPVLQTTVAGGNANQGMVCFVDYDHHELAKITVNSSTSTTANITVPLRYSYRAGGGFPLIFQGGACGTDLVSTGDFALSGMRTTYPVFGSLDGMSVITGWLNAGGWIPVPQLGYQSFGFVAPANPAFTLYPAVEVVATSAQGHVPQLGVNAIPFAVGDSVAGTHAMSVNLTGMTVETSQNSPANGVSLQPVIGILQTGTGISAGKPAILVNNLASPSQFQSGGGPLNPPSLINVQQGIYGAHLYSQTAPDYAMVEYGNCNSFGFFSLFDYPSASGGHGTSATYNCANTTFTFPNFAGDNLTDNHVTANVDLLVGSKGGVGIYCNASDCSPNVDGGVTLGVTHPFKNLSVSLYSQFGGPMTFTNGYGANVPLLATIDPTYTGGLALYPRTSGQGHLGLSSFQWGEVQAANVNATQVYQTAANSFAGTCAMAGSNSCTQSVNATYVSPPICIASAQGNNLGGGAGGCSYSAGTVTVYATNESTATWGFTLFGNPN